MRTRRQRYSDSTKRALVDVAEKLFTEHGYSATSLDAIVAGADVTKGALYHHFSGKDALFRAAYDAVLAEAVSAVMTAALAATDPWGAVRAGLSAFLDACLEPSFRRIVILNLDGSSRLSPSGFRWFHDGLPAPPPYRP